MLRNGELIFTLVIVSVSMARLRMFARLRWRFAHWNLFHDGRFRALGSGLKLAHRKGAGVWGRSRSVSLSANVRFGSKADIASIKWDVRFTPKSGHRSRRRECPLCAKSRLVQCSKTVLFDQLVSALQKRFRKCQPDCLGSR
jgi:hypothetical protein